MKISALQMCSSSNIEKNLRTVRKLISKASADHSKLIVLPEMFPFFGKKSEDILKVKETFKSGKIQKSLMELAKKYNIWIVAGTIPLTCRLKNKIKSACIIINSAGKIVGRYDKIHLFDVTISSSEKYLESKTVKPGNKTCVIDTEFGKIGIAICYDLRFPQIFNSLVRKGVQIICIPSAFTTTTGKAHWELLLKSRAIDCLSYVVGAGQGGKHNNNRETYGNSLIVDPWGKVIAHKQDIKEGIISAEIDLDYLKQIRQKLPILNTKRI